ncbi:MAG: rane protein [Candidatus Sulfotelmatobacter sp.]|nr:rane protein [Candidatus Sulfotelmatobacter sp.]
MNITEAVAPEPATKTVSAISSTPFAVTIFLSAFLLFQVQLIVGKQLLPWFGGTPAVWNTCLVFFQLLLLAGYAYAHWVTQRLKPPTLTRTHIALLLISVAVLVFLAARWRSPIFPGDSLRPQNPAFPTWDILMLLSASVGLPFFLLSTTGPLVQTWFARSSPQASPYHLYALSNLGSLLGLLTYPFLFEPNLSLRNQGRVWTLTYLLFVLACAICALHFARTSATTAATARREPEYEMADERPTRMQRFLWVGLAACGSIMLLSVTNLICQEIAVVPFLWALPLSIYLLSFVLCFHEKRFYRRGIFQILFAATAAWGGVLFLMGEQVKVRTQIDGFGLLLFAACMVYHGELAALKPNPRQLTSFYLHIATGGAIGSVLVGLIAPHVFPAIWEFQIGLWTSGLLLAVVLWQDNNSWLHHHPRWLAAAVALFVMAVADYIGIPTTILHITPLYFHILLAALAILTVVMLLTGVRTPARHPRTLQAVALCGWCLFGLLFWIQANRQKSRSVLLTRNFYGTLRVTYDDPIAAHHALVLRHGLTLHGAQIQAPNLRRTPTVYYGPSSGIGLLLTNHPNRSATNAEGRPLRLGVVGLGVGTLAAYGQAGDYFKFYEVNPEVVRLSRGESALFTYLNDTPAQSEVVIGDGRVSLDRELTAGNPQKFDVLVIDAFSSDSIPLHLLTREAMGIYLQHLRNPRSVLAFHISNRSLDLRPVLVGLAEQQHLHLIHVYVSQPHFDEETPSDWVLMASDPAILETPAILRQATTVQLPGPAPLWTDDYSNLLQVMK